VTLARLFKKYIEIYNEEIENAESWKKEIHSYGGALTRWWWSYSLRTTTNDSRWYWKTICLGRKKEIKAKYYVISVYGK
jgi:3'-phosphoadenosine 5'-phosphosulfate sulfotransferase